MTILTPWPACWKPDQARHIVADVATQDNNVMLAVHEEPALRRRRVPLQGQLNSAGPGEVTDQQALLDHFLHSDPPEGTLIVPIIGAPGTGKSHLIRWLGAMIPERADLVVRHIPREGTSLPNVVEEIFKDVEGDRFDGLRKALHEQRLQDGGPGTQADSLDQSARLEHVAGRLAFRITELLEQGLGSDWRRAKDVDPAIITALCAPTALPALLTDAAIRRRLTQPGGALHRLAHDIVAGYNRPDGDEDEELGFREADLMLGGVRNIGPYVRQTLVDLELPGNRDAAARILSDALDVAAAGVIGLGAISLTELLVEFRHQLHADGKQLLLLFEDIAIARGLQLDLVDAMTTAARRREKPLCTMRVALAVTSSYWEQQAPETLSTRARFWGAEMFDLDVPQAEAEQKATALIGRYLNAARVGFDEIAGRPSDDIRSGIENMCTPCDFKPQCHAAFGKTEHGHGLYPLTRTAAHRLPPLVDDRVRPRLILGDIVAPILQQHEVADAHRFPASDEWQRLVEAAVARREVAELSMAQIRAIDRESLTDADKARTRLVLRAWVGEAEDLEAVLSALALPTTLPSNTADEQPSKIGRKDDPVGPKVEWRDPVEFEINRWAGGNTILDIETARNLRRAMWDELDAGIRWDELGWRRNDILDLLGVRSPQPNQQPNVAVRIERCGGGGAMANRAKPLVMLDPGPDSADVLLAFHRRRRGDRRGRDRVSDLAQVRRFVRRAEDTLRVRIDKEVRKSGYVTEAAQVMNLAAAALRADLRELDAPVLPWLQELPRTLELQAGRTAAWTTLRNAAAAEYRFAVERIQAAATVSQGGGASAAIDPTMLRERSLGRDPAGLSAKFKHPEWQGRHERLLTLAEQAVTAEGKSIAAAVAAIASVVGGEERLPLKEISEVVATAMRVARQAQLLRPAQEVQELEAIELPLPARASDARTAAGVAARAAERGMSIDALERLSQVDIATLERVQRYLQLAGSILTASTDAAQQAVRQRATGDFTARGAATKRDVEQIVGWCEDSA